MLGCVAGTADTEAVFLAVIITAVVTAALTLFAFQTKYDFTVFNGLMLVALVVLILFGLITAIIGTSKITEIIYGSLGAIIFAAVIQNHN